MRKTKFDFPDHIVAAAARVEIESSKLMNRCADLKYNTPELQEAKDDLISDIRKQALKNAAYSLAFIEHLNKLL